ncbi:MAG: 23S rRNA (uracil(1939)-C(5))-methyltransferase RlmD [Bacteroidota bacterium]
MKRGDEFILHIDDAAFEGKSVARHEGFVVFVEGVVPGDEARVVISKVKKNFAEARAIEILQPSSFRVAPRCRYFGVCGGCRWQHLEYSKQCENKRQNVIDAFERIGGFRDIAVNPVIGADPIYHYRNKMEFSFGDKQWLTAEELENPDVLRPNFALGFHVPQRYDKILDIDECHLQTQLTVDLLNTVRSHCIERKLPVYDTTTGNGYLRFLVVREARQTGEVMVNLVTGKDISDTARELSNLLVQRFPGITTFVNTINEKKAQIAYGEIQKVYYGEGTIREKLGHLTFIISANSFFQTNTFQAERLYRVVKEYGEFRTADVVYDLYCGTGSIALFISDSVALVVGIDNIPSAVDNAVMNARYNNIANCEFVLGDLKDRLTKDTQWMRSNPIPDVLVIDPPRSGMHPKVVQEVIRLGSRIIVYVSCNPTTQARDVRVIVEGGYRIDAVQPLDMFPHTYHIENVVKLTKV